MEMKSSYGSSEPYKFLIKDKTKNKPAKLTQTQIFDMSKSKKDKSKNNK